MVQGIDNIGMCTTNVERLISFYKKLGFSEAYRNDRGVMMIANSVNLFMFATQQNNPPPVQRELGLFGNPPGIDHISLAVADVDTLYSTLRAAGVQFKNPPQAHSRRAGMFAPKTP